MNERSRVVTLYREVVAVTSSAGLAGVPANAAVVDDITRQGGLIFRDPADRDYLLVVEPEGVDLFGGYLDNEDIEAYLQDLAGSGVTADVYPASKEAVLAGERGWDVLFSTTTPLSAEDDADDIADDLVQVAADLDDLPELADRTVAAEITRLGGRIYRVAADSDYAADFTPDQTEDDEAYNAGATTIARYASLETAVTDAQMAELPPDRYLLVVIPAGATREQAVDITLLIGELPRYGFASPPESSTAANGNVHIAFDLGI